MKPLYEGRANRYIDLFSWLLFAGLLFHATCTLYTPPGEAEKRLHACYNMSNETHHYFQCDTRYNASKCLPVELLKNGVVDCLDASDEGSLASIIRDAMRIAPQDPSSFLIDACNVSVYPTKWCKCQMKDILFCSGSSLKSLESLVISNKSAVTVLVVKLSGLRRLDYTDYWIGYNNLQVLSLQNNKIGRISKGSFRGLSALAILMLKNAGLHTIDEGSFDQLISLTHLNLSYNKLREFFDQLLVSVAKTLTTLNLSGNHISGLKLHTLSKYNFLQVLNCSFNNISDLSEIVLPTSLSFLSLQRNKIRNIPQFLLSNMSSLRSLDLSFNEITFLPENMFDSTPNLKYLHLQHNSLNYLPEGLLNSLTNLFELDLSFNNLNTINNYFVGLVSLHTLRLDHNAISLFHQDAFASNQHLQLLSVSFNPLVMSTLDPLMKLSHLRKLYIRGVTVQKPEPSDTFLNNGTVQVSDYRDCRYFPAVVKCSYLLEREGISNFYDLLSNVWLRIAVFSIASVTCIGNLLVIFSRFCKRSDRNLKVFPIQNLAASDFLIGVYLFVLGSADIMFRGKYNEKALGWTNSAVCKAAGFLAMVSCEQSVLLLCFMALERFLVISNPIRYRNISKETVIGCIVATWVASMGISTVPLVQGYYSLSDICFPLYLADPWTDGWQFSFGILVGVNCVAVLVIAFCYGGMLVCILRTRRKSKRAALSEGTLAKRLFLIVLTDALCWLPVAILKVMAIKGFVIPSDAHAWVAIVVLPVNSALNPWLYTLSTQAFLRPAKATFGRVKLQKGNTSIFSTSLNSENRGRSRRSAQPYGSKDSMALCSRSPSVGSGVTRTPLIEQTVFGDHLGLRSSPRSGCNGNGQQNGKQPYRSQVSEPALLRSNSFDRLVVSG